MNFNDIGTLWPQYSVLFLLILIAGTIIGSFLNVCIIRLPLGESLVKRSSHCMTCGNKIKAYDLVPLFSWIFLKGKCRYCKSKISSRYPIVEALTGIMWALSFVKFDFTIKAIITALFFSALIVVAFMDFDTQTINAGVLIFIGLLAIPSYFLTHSVTITESLIGASIISIPFLIIGFITKGIGIGDTILMAVAGLYLGYKAITVATLTGLIIACIAGLIIKFVTKNSKFAFGPWLSIGICFATFFGNELFDLYVHTFLIAK